MSDASFFHLIEFAMLAAHQEEKEENVLQQEQAAKEEDFNRGHTLDELSKKTGLEEDQVRQAMKTSEAQFAHRIVDGNEARYDLRQHRDGQPEWQPGVNF